MAWLFLGVLYSSAYAATGWLLRGQPEVLSWFRAAALLVPPLTGATRHLQAASHLARLPVAVLVDDRARPDDVGDRADRMGSRGDSARPRHLARVARCLRALRRRRAAVRAARAAASRPARTAGRNHRHRHRRARGRHRLSLFVLRHRALGHLADSGLRAAAGAGRHRHGGRDVRRLELAVARNLSPSHARRVRQPRDAHAQQRRSLAGDVPHRVRLRLHLDSAVRVLPVGGGAVAEIEEADQHADRAGRTGAAAPLGDLHGGRDAAVPRLRPQADRAGRRCSRASAISRPRSRSSRCCRCWSPASPPSAPSSSRRARRCA